MPQREIGLRSLRTVKPVMTPTAKLITFLLDHINKANDDLNNGNPQGARAQLEYALIFANETLADNPEITRKFYMGSVDAVKPPVCKACGCIIDAKRWLGSKRTLNMREDDQGFVRCF